MTLFERYNAIRFEEHNLAAAASRTNRAEMHDLLNAEREKREAAEEELRPFKEYVAESDAMTSHAAAADAADRDAAAPTEEGPGPDG